MTSEIKVDTISEQTSANGVTIDGLTIKDGNIIGDVALAGTTPTFTIGDAGAEDASLIFDGNAQDFYVALDDSADDLVIGLGNTIGTTPIMSFDESKNVTIHDGTLKVESDNANNLVAPLLQLDRISSSPADGDLIGAIRYTARLDNGNSAEFAGLEAKIIESSTADGEITLNIAKGGNVRSAIKANNTEVIINDASEDIDFRVESNGNANMLFVDGGEDGVVIGSGAKGPAVQTLNPSFQIIGSTQNFASMSLIGTTNDADGTNIIGAKGRSANGGQGTIANSGDRVLNIRAVIDDGTNFDHEVGNIEFAVDGTPGANDTPGRIVFSTTADGANGATERTRIDSAGFFKAGSATATRFGGSYHELLNNTNTSGQRVLVIGNRTGDATNNTSSISVSISDTGNDRLKIFGNGDVVNINNSYGASSDVKIKENIVDASPKLNDLLQVKIRNYNIIGESTKQLGVVAQELETVFPGMVDDVPDYDMEGNNLGTVTKSVKYSVFVPMLVKAMQEQQTLIESLTARITTLEG